MARLIVINGRAPMSRTVRWYSNYLDAAQYAREWGGHLHRSLPCDAGCNAKECRCHEVCQDAACLEPRR